MTGITGEVGKLGKKRERGWGGGWGDGNAAQPAFSGFVSLLEKQ